MQCVDDFSLLLQGYVRKGNSAKNQAILRFFFDIERTMSNATHTQLLKKLGLSALQKLTNFNRSSS